MVRSFAHCDDVSRTDEGCCQRTLVLETERRCELTMDTSVEVLRIIRRPEADQQRWNLRVSRGRAIVALRSTIGAFRMR